MQPATPDLTKASSAVNQLGLHLLHERLKPPTGGNVVLSPLSLACALAMLTEGANADTRKQLEQAMGGKDAGLPPEQIGALAQAMLSKASVQIQSANALWLGKGLTLKEPYRDKLHSEFNAEAATTDFRAAGTLPMINHWFAEHTGGMIPHLLDQLAPQTRMLLANAMYFKGQWQSPFEASRTADHAFMGTGPAAKKRTVKLMNKHLQDGLYTEDDTAQALRLPFGTGNYQMLIVLPRPGKTPAMVLDAPQWTTWLDPAHFASQDVALGLPKIKLTSGGDFTETLKATGFAPIFAETADFSGMSDEHLSASAIVHRTALTVDEQGAEAAAATAVLMVRSAMVSKPPVQMIVDRPYLLAIQHVPTGAVLLIGAIADPR